jgi:hypothetical protein
MTTVSDDRSTPSTLRDGNHAVTITSVRVVKIRSGPDAGTPGLAVTLFALDGTATLTDQHYVRESSLWRLAAFLRAAGVKVGREDVALPLRELAGRTLRIEVEAGEVVSYLPAPAAR